MPSRSRKRPNERKPANARISERPAISSARRIAMKALTSLASSAAKAFKRHPRAPMPAEKGEALPDVAGIGLQRFRRQPPLGAQMRQPARHLKRESRHRRSRVRSVERRECGLGHELSGRDDLQTLYRISFVYRSLTRAVVALALFRPPQDLIPANGPHPAQPHLIRIIDPRGRCAGAGRAQPDLFLPGAARHGAEARRRRLRAARPARGRGGGVGGERQSRSAAA